MLVLSAFFTFILFIYKAQYVLKCFSQLQSKQITLLPSRPLPVEIPPLGSTTHQLCLQSGTFTKCFFHFHRHCSAGGLVSLNFIL